MGNNIRHVTTAGLLFLASSPMLALDVDLSGRSEQDTNRDATSMPAEMINFVEVKPGDSVLDLLGGGGYYAELLSRVVGDKGEVVLQIPKAYLRYVGKELDQRLADDRLKNVTYLLSESTDLKLGTEKFDSAFIVLGYHDMFFVDKDWDFKADVVMPQVLKSLKPGGKLLVIDHEAAKDHGMKDTKSLHRVESAFVKADLENNGFRFISKSDKLYNSSDDHSIIVFDAKMSRKTDRFVMLFEKAAK